MNNVKFLCSHLSAFLLGMIAVVVYHHWWVNPEQVKWIKTIALPGADIGYPGDWVLAILFPAIPLLGLSLLGAIIFSLIHLKNAR